MKRIQAVMTSLVTAVTFTASVNATPINPSIELTVKGSNYVVNGSESVNDIYNIFDSAASLGCDNLSLSNLGLVSGPINCATRNNNLVTSMSFDFTGAEADWAFRIGSDWGRGGALIIDDQLEGLYTGDRWWGRNWDSGQVIYTPEFTLDSGFHSVELIGFEGCCEGGTGVQFSYNGGDWQTVSLANLSQIAEVPVPSTLALLGLGALLIHRRKKQ